MGVISKSVRNGKYSMVNMVLFLQNKRKWAGHGLNFQKRKIYHAEHVQLAEN